MTGAPEARRAPRRAAALLLACLPLAGPALAQPSWSGEPAAGQGQAGEGPPPLPARASEPSRVLYTDEQRQVVADVFGEEATLSLTQDEAALLAARIAELARQRKEMETMAPERRRLMEAMMKQIEEEALVRQRPPPPELIREMRRTQRDSEAATERPLAPVHLAMRTVHHELGSVHAVDLRVSPSYVSTLIFVDAAGAPWPVAHRVLGDSSAVSSEVLDDGNGNVVVVQNSQQARFRESSAMFMLRGAQAPITVRILGDDRVVDARLTVQVPSFGPLSGGRRDVGDGLTHRDSRIMDMLGDPNQDYVTARFRLVAHEGTADGLARVEALRTDDGRVFVRGPMRLVSPSWTQQAVSETGMRIYEVPPVHQYIFAVEGERAGHGFVHARLEAQLPVQVRLEPPPPELAGAGG